MWSSLARCETVYHEMFQNFSCSMSDLSWICHDNPFMRFPVMLLTDKQTYRQTDRQTDIQTDGRVGGQTNRQTDRQADRYTDRQTNQLRWKQNLLSNNEFSTIYCLHISLWWRSYILAMAFNIKPAECLGLARRQSDIGQRYEKHIDTGRGKIRYFYVKFGWWWVISFL